MSKLITWVGKLHPVLSTSLPLQRSHKIKPLLEPMTASLTEILRAHVTFTGSHPPEPSPNLGAGEPSYLKVPLPNWERDLG